MTAPLPPPYATTHQGIDLVAVDRLLAGGPRPDMSEQELRYAAGLLADQGVSTKETARRVGVAERTITRWRADARK
ncbi:helix-turn-helix domain-containing protein [Streptomyces sp. NPDC055025]